MAKTNAVRLVQQAKIDCREAFYEYDPEDLNGMHAAEAIGMPPEQVFKTLVAKTDKAAVVVFCIPVCCELRSGCSRWKTCSAPPATSVAAVLPWG